MAVIYAVMCKFNSRAYIGCTGSTLNRRLNEHRSLLRKGKHTATQMLIDFKLYGDKAFILVTLEKLSDEATVEEKREAELRWMAKYKDLGLLYNAQMISFEPGEGYKERSHTPEANEKRRMAQLGKPKGHGDKISATKKALGQKPSREAYVKSQISRYSKLALSSDEIVSSAAKKKLQELGIKSPSNEDMA